MSLSFSPLTYINDMQRIYAQKLKSEYKEILKIHMTELQVLNYAHHVRDNDTFIIRHEKMLTEYNGRMKYVSMFYISKTNLYSRPTNSDSYRFANMAAYRMREYPVKVDAFEQDDDYCIRILTDYTKIPLHELQK